MSHPHYGETNGLLRVLYDVPTYIPVAVESLILQSSRVSVAPRVATTPRPELEEISQFFIFRQPELSTCTAAFPFQMSLPLHECVIVTPLVRSFQPINYFSLKRQSNTPAIPDFDFAVRNHYCWDVVLRCLDTHDGRPLRMGDGDIRCLRCPS